MTFDFDVCEIDMDTQMSFLNAAPRDDVSFSSHSKKPTAVRIKGQGCRLLPELEVEPSASVSIL